MQRRDILASSCARAAGADEARYRINAPVVDRRSTTVVALDGPARTVLDESRAQHPRVRFVATAAERAQPGLAAPAACGNGDGHPNGAGPVHTVALEDLDASPRSLADAVADADLVVMVATSQEGSAAAATIGDWCTPRRIMTAGLVVGPPEDVQGAVTALRPHARMLLVSQDAGDLNEILTALRA